MKCEQCNGTGSYEGKTGGHNGIPEADVLFVCNECSGTGKICNCVNVEVGSYSNQVELTLPPHMVKYKAKEGGADTICVDTCLVDEIKYLWSIGITTTGCCCGHNKVDPYIGVIERDISRMKEMDYIVRFNNMRPGDEDGFIPKSI